MPVPEPIVAIDVLLLDHAPNAVTSLKVVKLLTHAVGEPVIGAGVEVIFSTSVVIQPVGKVYVIVADPADIPVTIPVPDPTVATDVLLLVHIPPPEASVKADVDPMQYTDVVPPIGAGKAFTVNIVVAIQPDGAV